jgi:hypothetical protein
MLADDARRTAGLMDAVVRHARRLHAELPEDVDRSVVAWRLWAGRLAVWAHGDVDQADSDRGE